MSQERSKSPVVEFSTIVQPDATTLGSLAQQSLFDIEKLRLDQDFSARIGVKRVIRTIPVRKPHKQEYVRVHPDDDMIFQTAILELREDHENYLVAPSLWAELPNEIKPTVLFVTISRQKVLSLWPVRLPDDSGRRCEWHQSALEAAQLARKSWVRVSANLALGAYEIYQAAGNLSEPEWPDLTLQEILEIAFKGRYIDSLDHVVLQRLSGAA